MTREEQIKKAASRILHYEDPTHEANLHRCHNRLDMMSEGIRMAKWADENSFGINGLKLDLKKDLIKILEAQLAIATDLIIRCQEKLDDSDESDDLWCDVNSYIDEIKKP